MHDTNLKFVEIANPHSWLLSADNLHAQALYLKLTMGRGSLTRTDFGTGTDATWDNVNKSVYLLAGFALENAIKAFLVYENPHWISNGKLSKHLRSHALVALREKSRRIPYQKRYKSALMEFETGIESWARYPCSITVEAFMDETVMQPELWDVYLTLMRAYGNRLQELLRRGWHGPHGFYGRWTFTAEFLSMARL